VPVSFNLPPDPDEDAGQPPAARPSRGRALVLSLVVVILLVVGFWIFAGFYTDLLWFRSVNFSSVFRTELKTRIILFVLFGGVMAAVVVANCWVAYRTRPAFRGISAEQQGLDRYRVALDPYRRLVVGLVAAVLALIAGGSAASEWKTVLAFMNSQPFRSKDAQFGLDISFFVFRLPFWRFLVGFGFALVVVSLLAALVTHYLYGGLRLQTPGEKTTPAARAHIAVLLGAFVLMKAAAYWFDRYGLVVKSGDRIDGATYTDVNALLPAKLILFVIAIICALLFFATVITRNWLAPALGFGLLVLSAIVIGGIYPFFVQQFQVHPSEADKEAPYIQRNIDATLKAYDLNSVRLQNYPGTVDPKEAKAAASTSTVVNVRLIDPAVVSRTFQQLQGIRGYYRFLDTLDVDRYQLAGAPPAAAPREAVVAVRELDTSRLQASQHNFTNDHTVYTHGFGFVAAYGNSVQPNGAPTFFSYNIPPQGLLAISQPRLYFGETSPDYSIVGAPSGKAPVEFDYPTDTGSGQANYTYTGNGGVPMGSLFGRILFATKFGEPNILLSDRINSDSRILWNRDPRDRVQQVAPWLTPDGDPYPAVIDGHIMWIVDCYTTSNDYPYSERTTLGEATSDSVTASGSNAVVTQQPNQVNYIRNSVKATVDAYTGAVTLYEWDPTGQHDPVLETWSRAFPGTITPYDKISDSLMQHLRYPEDLFKVQRELYARYHVTDPRNFYGGQNFWKIPDDPTKSAVGSAPQPPYYLTLAMPGQDNATFSLTTTFAPNNRTNLAGFMAVDSQPGADYGVIRVLQLPGSTNVPGPEQVQANFESNTAISSQLTLLRNGGSTVVFGNLLSLPVAGTLLYVEPMYVAQAGGSTYPLLRKVLVSFQSNVAMEDTLAQSLAVVLGGSPATSPGGTGGGTGGGGGGGGGGGPTGASAQLQRVLLEAQQAIADANAALKRGDFAAYGAAQQRLAALVAEAARLAHSTSTAPSPAPSGSPSPSPTSTVSGASLTGIAGAWFRHP
jgi:uncharacterized membrane protein (UPF0182 family)